MAAPTIRKHTSLCTVLLVVLGEFFCLQNGFNALHIAAQEGKVNVVKLLSEAMAHVNIETEVCDV